MKKWFRAWGQNRTKPKLGRKPQACSKCRINHKVSGMCDPRRSHYVIMQLQRSMYLYCQHWHEIVRDSRSRKLTKVSCKESCSCTLLGLVQYRYIEYRCLVCSRYHPHCSLQKSQPALSIETDQNYKLYNTEYCRTGYFVSQHFRYFLEISFRLNSIFVFLAARHIGSAFMAAYLVSWAIFVWPYILYRLLAKRI